MSRDIRVILNIEVMDSNDAGLGQENEPDQQNLEEVLAVFDFPVQEIAQKVAHRILEDEACPFDAEVSITLTGDAQIHRLNREFRGIDRETDVLSFPNITFRVPSDFTAVEAEKADCFDPDTGALVLGDIVININRVRSQAKEYGHSERREFAFLVAHSMLHLCGYDHMTPEEEGIMESKQEKALQELGITRDGE